MEEEEKLIPLTQCSLLVKHKFIRSCCNSKKIDAIVFRVCFKHAKLKGYNQRLISGFTASKTINKTVFWSTENWAKTQRKSKLNL